jgi:DNA-binding MarR family transcriptional regulator
MLRPSGLNATQFTLLQALNYASEISQKQLAELLEIDSTTLTRTLPPLRREGWLQFETAADRRELRLSLTANGKREYKRALPYWRSAQKGLDHAGREGELESLNRYCGARGWSHAQTWLKAVVGIHKAGCCMGHHRLRAPEALEI